MTREQAVSRRSARRDKEALRLAHLASEGAEQAEVPNQTGDKPPKYVKRWPREFALLNAT